MLARYGSLGARSQNKTGSLKLASEATCKPKAPKGGAKGGGAMDRQLREQPVAAADPTNWV